MRTEPVNRRQAAAGRRLITATLAFINSSVYRDVLPQGERVPSHPFLASPIGRGLRVQAIGIQMLI